VNIIPVARVECMIPAEHTPTGSVVELARLSVSVAVVDVRY